MQTRSAWDQNHPSAHYVVGVKINWSHSASELVKLIKRASVENPANCLPQEKGLVYFGQDNKTGVPISRKIGVSVTNHQSTKAIVPLNTDVVRADHDLTSEKNCSLCNS